MAPEELAVRQNSSNREVRTRPTQGGGSMKAKAIALMLAASVGLIGTCNAQSYPTQSVTITVPFPPGGLFDSIARMVGKYLQNELGQPVVIENRGGAG